MARDKEKNREWRKKYNEEHKEEISKYKREYNTNPINRSRATKKANEWAKRNPGKVRESNKKCYNPEKDRERKLRKKYGISIEEYNNMFDMQNGCCSICKKHQSQIEKPLFVDHEHSTGKIRGLICFRCNSAIGLFNDNINNLINAIIYLKGEK